MIIPTGVNQLDFYRQAISKGIHIESRYPGVYIGYRHQHKDTPFWLAQCKVDGKTKRIGRFPFSEVGELDAFNAYTDYMNQYGNTIPRTVRVKRKDKWSSDCFKRKPKTD